jgi:hypothetical protein
MDRIVAMSPGERDVAFPSGGQLISRQRPELTAASPSESAQYEEFLVNPTLLRLITQRGPIACDGAWFVVVGYGNGHQLVIPLSDGHRSVNFELSASPLEDMAAITRICQTSGFPASAPSPSSGAPIRSSSRGGEG